MAELRGRVQSAHERPADVVVYECLDAAYGLRQQGRFELALKLLEAADDARANAELRGYSGLLEAELARVLGRFEASLQTLDEVASILAAVSADPRRHIEGANVATTEAPAIHPTRALDLDVRWLTAVADTWQDLGVNEHAARYVEAALAVADAGEDPSTRALARAKTMRYALVTGDFPRVERLYAAMAEEETLWPEVHLLRVWAAIDSSVSGGEPAFDPEPELERLAALGADELGVLERRSVDVARVTLSFDRGRWKEAAARLAELRAVGGEFASSSIDPDSLRLLAAELRLARLSGARDDLAAVHTQARTSLLALGEQWAARPRVEGGAGLLHSSSRSDLLVEFVRASTILAGEKRGVVEALDLLSTLQATDDSPFVSWNEAEAALLAPERGLVVYLSGRAASLALCGDGDAWEVVELPSFYGLMAASQRLERATHAALEEPGERTRRRLAKAAAEAARAFLDPLREELAGHRELLVIGLESFGWPLIELCEWEPDTDFGLAFEVSYAPTLPRAFQLARRARTSARAPLIVAAPSASKISKAAGLAPLDDPSATVRAILRSSEDSAPEPLVGTSATLEGLHQRLPEADSLTMVVHGLFDPLRPQPAGLALAASSSHSGAIWAHDVARLEAPSFVALFTCYAAAGPVRRGSERAAHLGESFLSAGARAVALSKAPLSYRPSLEMAEALQRELRDGAHPAAALRAARRGLVARDRERHRVHAQLMRIYGFGFD